MTSWLSLRELRDSQGGHGRIVGDGREERWVYVGTGRKAGSSRNGVHHTWPAARKTTRHAGRPQEAGSLE